MTRHDVCPICKTDAHSSLYVKRNYDDSILNDVDGFAFASRKIPELFHHDIMKCDDCQVLWSAHMNLNADQLKKLYGEADFDSKNEAMYASRTYYKYLMSIRGGQTSGIALDIGTGEGSFLECLLDGGWKEVYGIEPSVAPIQAASERVRPHIKNAMFEAGIYPENSFDLVTCFQTMEHVYDPMGTLEEIYRILKPGGTIYLVDHDYTSLVNRMLGTGSPIYDIEHMQIFSPHGIQKAVTGAGFSDVHVFSVWNTYPLNYWAKLFPMPVAMKKTIMKFFETILIGKLPIPVNVGNMGTIACKPKG